MSFRATSRHDRARSYILTIFISDATGGIHDFRDTLRILGTELIGDESSFNNRALGPRTYTGGICAATGEKTQPSYNHRLTCAGFTCKDGEPG